MSQYEQENDLGAGGGEVDEETLAAAWARRERRAGDHEVPSDVDRPDPHEVPAPDAGDADEELPADSARNPWAKTSSGDVDTP